MSFTHFSGNGEVLDYELTTDPGIVQQCKAAFEAAWAISIPHGEYTPT